MAKTKVQQIEWRDRYVETITVRADEIAAHPRNPKVHGEFQKEALTGLLADVGKVDSLKAYRDSAGNLICWDGHCRRDLNPAEMWRVDVFDLQEEEVLLLLASFDPVGWQAQQSAVKLNDLLRDVSTGQAAVMEMLSKEAERCGAIAELGGNPEPGAGGDEFDAAPEETQTRVRYGDLWECGAHRVLCGDSTKAADVARVMAGEKAVMCFTDPPYNVNYGGNPNPRHKIRSIENDHLGEDFTPFITKALSFVLSETMGAVYICMSDKEWARMFGVLEGLDAHWSSTIVWAKDRLVLSPKDYHSRHELIWYGWREGGRRLPLEDRTQTDVWEIPRPSRSDEHPTMKPVELVERAVGNSSASGAIVYEPFGGSGTTLIACERLNRKARVIEIEPKYVNVILSRYEAETGNQARLLERLDG